MKKPLFIKLNTFKKDYLNCSLLDLCDWLEIELRK